MWGLHVLPLLAWVSTRFCSGFPYNAGPVRDSNLPVGVSVRMTIRTWYFPPSETPGFFFFFLYKWGYNAFMYVQEKTKS